MTDQERIESLFRESFLEPFLACLEVHSSGVYQLQAGTTQPRHEKQQPVPLRENRKLRTETKGQIAGPF
jgi:hypothetical protein